MELWAPLLYSHRKGQIEIGNSTHQQVPYMSATCPLNRSQVGSEEQFKLIASCGGTWMLPDRYCGESYRNLNCSSMFSWTDPRTRSREPHDHFGHISKRPCSDPTESDEVEPDGEPQMAMVLKSTISTVFPSHSTWRSTAQAVIPLEIGNRAHQRYQISGWNPSSLESSRAPENRGIL